MILTPYNIEIIQQNDKDKEKLNKLQKFACFCATYRFLYQLLVGIGDMKRMKDLKKEVFLYLIIVNLSLKSDDRIVFIIKAVNI